MPFTNARRQFERWLPPASRGIDAVGHLAQLLKGARRDDQISLNDACALLAEGLDGARRQLIRLIQTDREREGGRVAEEDIEDALSDVLVALPRLFDRWGGESFVRYFAAAVKNKLVDQFRKQHREILMSDEEFEGVSVTVPASDENRDDIWEDIQVANRFVWYVYGSPDNPKRIDGPKGVVDMMALKARLERRPASELVLNCQPRVGDWGPGQGEPDERWWRGRAQEAKKKVILLLQQPEFRAQFEHIRRSIRSV